MRPCRSAAQLAVTAGVNGWIYTLGGYNFTDQGEPGLRVDAYVPARNAWVRMPSIPFTDNDANSNWGAATGCAGRIYAMGGEDPRNGTGRDTVWSLWPGQAQWTTVAPMPVGLLGLAVVRGPNCQIYAIGGSTGIPPLRWGSTVERYDTYTGRWSIVAALPQARGELAAATIDGRVFALGGAANERVYNGTLTVTAYAP